MTHYDIIHFEVDCVEGCDVRVEVVLVERDCVLWVWFGEVADDAGVEGVPREGVCGVVDLDLVGVDQCDCGHAKTRVGWDEKWLEFYYQGYL